MTVPRHEVPTDKAERAVEVLSESVSETLEDLESSPREFNSALSTSLLAAEARLLLDPDAGKVETWDGFVTAMQVGSAMFEAAITTTEQVNCRIAHRAWTIPTTGPRSYANAGNWLTSFWLSLICREGSRMDTLSAVPLNVLRESGAEFDEYMYSWVDSLQTYCLEGSGLHDKLLSAIEGSDPEIARIAGRELLLKILYPPMEMFLNFLRDDRDKFNESLLQALNLHKSYWTADAERAASVSGLVALGPLAIACHAHDAGMPIDVESGYLPKHLLDRSWLGEFDT